MGKKIPPEQKPAAASNDTANATTKQPPSVTGQCAEVLAILREHPQVLSFHLTADHAIPEAAARIHDLRAKGFNIATVIEPEVTFRGRVRRNVARYVLGSPAWPRPGFIAEEDEAA